MQEENREEKRGKGTQTEVKGREIMDGRKRKMEKEEREKEKEAAGEEARQTLHWEEALLRAV